MRPLFTKHVAHPVRSRFSVFSFSISKPSTQGTERIRDDSLKTSTSSAQKPPPIYNGLRHSHDPSAQQEMVDPESRDRWSLYWNEPWGRNIGAADPAGDLQPWGQNIGSPERPRDWELEIIPIGTPKMGPQTDGRVEKWDVPWRAIVEVLHFRMTLRRYIYYKIDGWHNGWDWGTIGYAYTPWIGQGLEETFRYSWAWLPQNHKPWFRTCSID